MHYKEKVKKEFLVLRWTKALLTISIHNHLADTSPRAWSCCSSSLGSTGRKILVQKQSNSALETQPCYFCIVMCICLLQTFPITSLSAACPLTSIQSFAFKEYFPVCSAEKGGRTDGCVLSSQSAMQVMAIAVSNWRRLKFLLAQPHAFLKCKIPHGFGLKHQGHQAYLKFVWTKGSIHEVQAIWLPLNVHT